MAPGSNVIRKEVSTSVWTLLLGTVVMLLWFGRLL